MTVPRIGPSTMCKSDVGAETLVTSVVQRNVRPRNLPVRRTRAPGRTGLGEQLHALDRRHPRRDPDAHFEHDAANAIRWSLDELAHRHIRLWKP